MSVEIRPASLQDGVAVLSLLEEVGYYHRTLSYADVEALEGETPTVFVDMGGDAEVRARIHHHVEGLRHSCMAGATHWEQASFGGELPGPAPQLFFAPDHLQRLEADIGGSALQERLGAAQRTFLASVDSWLEVVRHEGPEAVAKAYEDVLEGRVPPSHGYVISLSRG